MPRPAAKTFEAEVEVDLSEWDTEELLAELESRGCEVPGGGDVGDLLRRLHEALLMDRCDEALDLARGLVWETIGRAV